LTSSQASVPTAGNYVPAAAATKETPAGAGYYVSTSGATSETPVQAGYYDTHAGQTASTRAVALPVGYYSATAGLSASSLATPSPPGFYVGSTGMTAPTQAQPGYYAAGTGATNQTRDLAGFYTPVGAPAQIPCPTGLTCTGGILPGITTTGYTLLSSPAPGTYSLGAATLRIPLGSTTATQFSLTAPGDTPYQITGWGLGGANPGLFTVDGLYVGEDIAAGQTIDFSVLFDPIAYGLSSALLTIDTTDGGDPNYTITLDGQAIPEPASIAGLLSGLAGLGWVGWLKRRSRNGKDRSEGSLGRAGSG
jgi:hypothetical protein